MVLDNCEHLLEASAALVNDVLAGCSQVTILATSREPLMVAGEVNWQVPSLSLADEAVELFTDRARRARPDFAVTDVNSETVTEICRRLDGMPLAIELAAARVRALSLDEIVGSLHDRFRLLTGGARTAVRRQQTLRASVDWSHALLTEPERILFRRLAAFMGGFDLDAAQAVAGTTEVERFQVLDQLSLLVDKSLVVAENAAGRTRYRLLETVRQYALEKLGESGEADDVRARHRDHFWSMAARSTRRRPAATENACRRYCSKWTTYAPLTHGVGRTARPQRRWNLPHGCSRCGWGEVEFARGWPGSTLLWSMIQQLTATRLRHVCGHCPTGHCSTPGTGRWTPQMSK